MALDIVTLQLAKKYTDTEVAGGGAIRGKNCVVSDISAITGGHRVTFEWVLDNGTVQTGTMDVMDGEDGSQGETGLGVKSVAVNNSNHLIVTFDDDTTEDAGEIKDVSTSFDKITDVDLSNLQDGQILKYNATTQKWENASAGSVDTNLVDLNDVNVESPTDGQIIAWDSASGRWVNVDNAPTITIDSEPTAESTNAVSSGGVYTALSGKVDAVSGKVLSDNNYSDADAAAVAALGTAASLNVAASGDAATTEVVKGDDTRLTDSRNAADVYSWAKESTKPTYTASEVGAVATTVVGVANGVAELDSAGKVPSAQLPSYVDAVVEGYLYNGTFYEDAQHTTAITPSTGVIYVDLVSNNTYRWGGSAYVEISESLALGETSTTAYRGDHGKANADAITAIKDGTTIDSFGDVETALADKISKSQTAGLVKNDGTIDTNSYATTSQLPDITGKADKVTSATSGNFAGLDSNGNLTDSGSKASDFATASSVHSIPSGGTSGQVLAKNSGTDYDVTWVNQSGGGDEGEMLTGTLLAASWSNNTQTVSVTGLMSSDIGSIGILNTATSAQIEAAQAAVITPTTVSNGTVTFTCINTPSIDIPFGVLVTGSSPDSGIPDGGTTGQVLQKKSNTDLDVEWGTVTSVPAGGTTGQVLSKHSNTDGDVEWTSPADTSKMYSTDDTAFTDIVDGDYIPVYDSSATTKKKSLWSNIKSLLKTYFDTLYQPKFFYSESEQVVGTWITGKPLYQKTINFGSLPNNSNKTVAHNIAKVNQVVSINAFGYNGTGTSRTYWNIPYTANGAITDQVMMYIDPTNINIATKKDMTSSGCYVTLQYTKTTD